jgi:hypothetical protein
MRTTTTKKSEIGIKLKRGTDKHTRARKAWSTQKTSKTPKLNKAESRELSTQDSTWEKSNRNTGISKPLSIITLNVNRLYSSIKTHRLSHQNKKQDQTICYLQETHLTSKDTHKLEKQELANPKSNRKRF